MTGRNNRVMLCAVVAVAFAAVLLAGSADAASPSGVVHGAFVWAPANDIVFARGGGIWVVSANGGKPRLLTTKVGTDLTSLDVSPDGKTLLYGAVIHGGFRLLTIPLSGGVPRDLGVSGIGGVWSPDGKQVAYAGGDGEYVAEASGRNAHKVVANP